MRRGESLGFPKPFHRLNKKVMLSIALFILLLICFYTGPSYHISSIFMYFYKNDSIKCYRYEGKTLPEISTVDIRQGKSIFFHETSCNSYLNRKIVIASREACAVESAALLNPNLDVYLLFTSPGIFKFEGTESDRFLKALMSYKNVKIHHLNYEKYTKGTPLEDLYKNGVIEASQYALSHASDVLRKLRGKTIFITGASRGIGEAIAIKCAKDGANIVIAAKSAEQHPKLPGTIYTAAEKIEKSGGKALPCIVDVRYEDQIQKAIDQAVEKFGGIDIVINNASAINLSGTEDLDIKRYDLMQNINTRGSFLVSKLCLPYLKKSKHAHILNLSPPLEMESHWFAPHVGYTISKYGMSMLVLGMAEELRSYNIAVNALWPRYGVQTAALDMLTSKESAKYARKPEIMADAAYAILIKDPKQQKSTGNFHIDDDVLKTEGVTDFDQYCVDPAFKDQLIIDFFVSKL